MTRDRRRSAHAVHHRRRRAHVASGGRRRRGRARAARDVGARRAPWPSATPARPGLLGALDSVQIVFCQTWEYDDAVARLAHRLGADPRHRHYSGIGGTTTQQLVNEHVRGDAARRDGPRADHERRGAGDQAAAQAAGRSATRRRSRPRNARRFRGSRRPIRSRSRTRCSRPGSRSRCSTTPAGRGSAPALDEYRAEIGEMLAPMTQIAARNPHAWFRVERTARRDRRGAARQPHGRLPVHQVHGVGDGRRHGRRASCSPRTSAPTRSASRSTGACTRAAGATRAIRCSSPSTPTSRARRRWRPRARRRCASRARPSTTSRTSTSTRASRARCTSRATRSASRAAIPAASRVTGGLPYHGGPGERVPHPLDRGDGRAAARRARRDRVRERRRHAHDEARVRRLPGDARSGRAARRRPACRPRSTPRAGPRWSPSTTARPRSAPTRSCTVATAAPEWALLVCDLPGGDRTYAQVRDAELCVDAEADELVGTHGDAEDREPSTARWAKHG